MQLKPISDFSLANYHLPVGILLVAASGPQDNILIGDEISSCYDASFGDGGTSWEEVIHRYIGYYDYRELLGLISKPEVDPFKSIYQLIGPGCS